MTATVFGLGVNLLNILMYGSAKSSALRRVQKRYLNPRAKRVPALPAASIIGTLYFSVIVLLGPTQSLENGPKIRSTLSSVMSFSISLVAVWGSLLSS